MQDFGVREVAAILGWPTRQVRRFVRDGLVRPRRGARGALRFDFRDLVVLRSAKGLLELEVPPGRVRRALAALQDRLPETRSLAEVQVTLIGDELVVRDGSGTWEPVTGQSLFDFSVAELYAQVAPLEAAFYRNEAAVEEDDDESDPLVPWPGRVSTLPTSSSASLADLDPDDEADGLDAEDWLEIADTMEADRRLLPARDALRRALELDPHAAFIRQRLGRLLEQEGRVDLAEAHFRLARLVAPTDPELALDHGRVLAHLGEARRALEAFEAAIALQPELEAAYLGASDMYERLGDVQTALRLLNEVRRRRRDPPDPP